MSNHSLMLFSSFESSEPASGSAAFAVAAAAALGAHLQVIAPFVDLIAPADWAGLSAEEIEMEGEKRRNNTKALASAIEKHALANGVSVSSQTEWAHAFGLAPYLGDQAKLYDLTITGADRSTFLSERKIAEHILFQSGRPVVIVPAAYKPPFVCKRVVVAWDHTRTAARAFHDSLPFLHLADEVILVAVGGEKRFQTSSDPGTVEEALARKGLNAKFRQIDLGTRTIGQALQDHALDNGADLLVMGAYGHSRLHEFMLGGATREVLDEPRLPVLMSH